MSKPTDRPEFNFILGLGIGFLAMALSVAAMLAANIRSGYYGVMEEQLPHAVPYWGPH